MDLKAILGERKQPENPTQNKKNNQPKSNQNKTEQTKPQPKKKGEEKGQKKREGKPSSQWPAQEQKQWGLPEIVLFWPSSPAEQGVHSPIFHQ